MTPAYKIIHTHATLYDLAIAVNLSIADGYEPASGPFRDEESREWCQALVLRRIPAENGQVRLRETKHKL